MLHPVAARAHDDHTQSKAGEVLLEFKPLVRGEEDRKAALGCTAKELAVLETAPALLLNRPALMDGELAGELSREGLV